MGRKSAVLVFVSIVVVTVVLCAIVIWQALAHGIRLLSVVGGFAVVIGTLFSILHLSVSDENLRQHFGGEENANRLRKIWRGAWVAVLVGAALIAEEYFLGLGQ